MVRCGACLRVFAADDNLLPSIDLRTINVPVKEEIEEDEELEALDEQLPITELDIEDEALDDEEEVERIFTLDMADSVPNRLSPSISTNEPFWQLVEEDTETEVETLDERIEEEEEPNLDAHFEVDEESSLQEITEEYLEEPDEVILEPEQESEEVETEAPLTQPIVVPKQRDENTQIRSRMTAIDFDDDILNDNSDAKSFTRFSAEEIESVSDAETPLELDWQATPRRNGSQAALWLLSMLLILGIAGQYLWFNKDDLSQNPRVRPLLDLICGPLPCDLPPLVNIRAIRSDTLVVRSHNEIANALSVNFQFQNNASFAQPFPGLALTFMDVNDGLVAQRRFAPQEYLPEGVADLRLMPPGSPVQVRLDILDPGGKAVNYELSFFANQAD